MGLIQNLISMIFKAGLVVFLFSLHAGHVMAQDNGSNQTLNEKLQAQSAAFAERVPAMVGTINNSIQDLENRGILDRVIKVGDRAPDFELPDATGKNVKLSDMLAKGPVILTWYRGNW